MNENRIVIVVEGGVVSDIYGPDDLKITLVDWDHIKDGGNVAEFRTSETVDSEVCQEVLETAREDVEYNEECYKNAVDEI